MATIENKDRLRREQGILDRLEDVKRLIQMETTIMTNKDAYAWRRYRMRGTDDLGSSHELLHELRDSIQLQLLSILALCRGDNPDVGEPAPMLAWNYPTDSCPCPAQKFYDVMGECLTWME